MGRQTYTEIFKHCVLSAKIEAFESVYGVQRKGDEFKVGGVEGSRGSLVKVTSE